MLDIFTSFLINKNKHFQYTTSDTAISLFDFQEESVKIKETAMEQHLSIPAW